MKLGSASRYAVCALVQMARRPDATHDAHRLAGAYGLRGQFMLQTFRRLLKAGIVYPVRGRTGGYRLARPAKDVTLLEVVQAVDGPIQPSLHRFGVRRPGAGPVAGRVRTGGRKPAPRPGQGDAGRPGEGAEVAMIRLGIIGLAALGTLAVVALILAYAFGVFDSRDKDEQSMRCRHCGDDLPGAGPLTSGGARLRSSREPLVFFMQNAPVPVYWWRWQGGPAVAVLTLSRLLLVLTLGLDWWAGPEEGNSLSSEP